jgi:ribosomal-protein-alanine N-acetyltransferase
MAFPSTLYLSKCTNHSRMNQHTIEISHLIVDDIDEVLSIENTSFLTPWSRDVFIREHQIPISRNLVAKMYKNQSKEIAGYVIYWVIAGEAQLHKIAVRKDLRNSGIATKLMAEMLRLSCEEGALLYTLEVGQSNESAKKLYEKFGFVVTEIRKRYYQESGDDALIMCLNLKS